MGLSKERLYSGIFYCPDCDIEYELDRVPEREVVCDECGSELEEIEE